MKRWVMHFVGKTSIVQLGVVEKQDFSIVDSKTPKITPFAILNRTIIIGEQRVDRWAIKLSRVPGLLSLVAGKVGAQAVRP